MSASAAPVPFAIGWATVEHERALVELADRLVPGGRFEPAAESVLLGARCLVGRAADRATATWLVLLEPSTEGRLSATLARHGEGWVATWSAAAADGTVMDAASDDRADRGAWSTVQPGPLGPERLRLGGSVFGPHRLVLVAATIEA